MANKQSERHDAPEVPPAVPDHERSKAYWARVGDDPPSNTGLSPGTRWEGWEGLQRWLLQRWSLRQLRRRMARRARVVDLGCGNGDLTARLAMLADEIVAVDFSPGLVRQTSARLRGHPRARAVCADIREFHELGEPDLVSIGGVLMYLADRDAEQTLHRVRDSMRPGAFLLHREYVAHHDGDEARLAGTSSSFRRPASRYRLWAASAGFSLVAQRHSPAIFASQAIYETLGLRSELLSRVLAIPPVLLMQALMSRTQACSWSALYEVR